MENKTTSQTIEYTNKNYDIKGPNGPWQFQLILTPVNDHADGRREILKVCAEFLPETDQF